MIQQYAGVEVLKHDYYLLNLKGEIGTISTIASERAVLCEGNAIECYQEGRDDPRVMYRQISNTDNGTHSIGKKQEHAVKYKIEWVFETPIVTSSKAHAHRTHSQYYSSPGSQPCLSSSPHRHYYYSYHYQLLSSSI